MKNRILVTGGRSFSNLEIVHATLKDLPEEAVLVHGNARGADALCRDCWHALDRVHEAHPADWEGPCDPAICKPGHRLTNYTGRSTYCPAAGIRRNQVMVELGADLLIAFPGGRGTRDMVHRCQQAGIGVMTLSVVP